MFKYLLILTILFYVFYKVVGFIFRIVSAGQQFRQRRPQEAAPDGKKNGKTGTIKGGEYVDFEEVK